MSNEHPELEEHKRSPLVFFKMLLAKRMKPVDLETRYKIERPEGVKNWFTEAYAKADQPSEWKITTVDWDTPSGDTKAFLQLLDEPSEE